LCWEARREQDVIFSEHKVLPLAQQAVPKVKYGHIIKLHLSKCRYGINFRVQLIYSRFSLLMFSTRLPLDLLEAYLPTFLYAQHDKAMFDEHWHVALNKAFLLMSTVAIVGCMFNGRWIMQQDAPKSLLVRQFYLLLVVHSLFYIAEIFITAVSILYFNMVQSAPSNA
jgi:hypothetical protein